MYQAEELTKSTRVTPASGSSPHLGLNEELHDGHGCAVDSILLVAGGGTTRLVKELRCLGHGETD